MRKISTLIIILPLVIFAAEWQSLNGPPAGRADDMSIGWDPIHSYWAIFAADRTHKLYKSVDEGELWEPIEHEYIVNPTCVITCPNRADTVYIGKYDATPVWKSDDGGVTWAAKSSGITNNNPLCFAMDPNNSSIVYLGCGTGPCAVFKTEDGGETWDAKDISSGTDPYVNDIAITHDPLRGIWIIAGCSGTSDRGIWLSTNGGNNWNQQMSNDDIYTVEFANQSVGYAGADERVYKTENGGGYWVLLTDSPQYTNSLKAINEDIVYAATRDGGMYKTPDGGATWYEINEGICARKLLCLISHPSDYQTLFAGGKFSLYKTTDGGGIWKEVIEGFKILNLKDISNISDKNLE
jgi:photosystem II stability/assembly factor-like uncharacterized protein